MIKFNVQSSKFKVSGFSLSPLFPFRFCLLAYSFCLFALAFSLNGCAYYSFTGASIPEHLNTIAIPLVVDNSLNTIPELGDRMTEELVTRFVNQTRLSLTASEEEADVVLTVEIQRYNTAPSSISGDEVAARNRVSISVMVTYYDQVEEKELLQRSFSNFEDYDPLVIENETEAAFAALENVADDIFTAATSNW